MSVKQKVVKQTATVTYSFDGFASFECPNLQQLNATKKFFLQVVLKTLTLANWHSCIRKLLHRKNY